MDGSNPPLPVLSREAFVRIAVVTFPTNNNRLDNSPRRCRCSCRKVLMCSDLLIHIRVAQIDQRIFSGEISAKTF